jgi:hypothetical protein
MHAYMHACIYLGTGCQPRRLGWADTFIQTLKYLFLNVKVCKLCMH